MATDDPIRASDADREVVVDALRDAFTAGRLTLDEFEERMSAAWASRTWGDLRQLTTDLPSQPLLGTDVPVDGVLSPSGASSGAVPSAGSVQDPDEVQDPALVPARRRPMAMLIPLAVWTLLVLHTSVSTGFVFLMIAVFALISVMASIRRR
jgi:hypothetical protein